MKQCALLFVLAFLLQGCGNNESDFYTIKGSASDIKEGTKLFLTDLGQDNKRIAIDTAVVKEGLFYFRKPQKSGKGLQLINVEGIKGQILLVKDDSPLDITIYKDSIDSSVITGSIENELFNNYRNANRRITLKKNNLRRQLQQAQREQDGIMVTQIVEQIKVIDERYITDRKDLLATHSDKMVSIAALSDLINAKVVTGKETESYFNDLGPEVKASAIGKSVEKYIAQRKSQEMASKLASVGNKAPGFTAQTPDGTELSLEDTLGEYTIVDFWASWCKPCRMENPNVVSVYKQYHDKGLNIVSVSLDKPGQKERWIRAIEQDQMDWYHVSNLQFWQDPIPRSYGVRAIPATFLLDKNGVIIAKDLRGRALQNKMRELLGS